MELQPSLEGSFTKLLPLESSDFESLYQAASDPLIWEQHPQKLRYQKEIFQSFFQGAIDSKGALKVIDKATGEVIGSSRFYGYDSPQNTVIIGYSFLQRQFWGGKFNSEMKHLMLSHAFQTVDRVLFEVGSNNIRSQTAIGRIGASLLEHRVLDGVDHHIYKIDRKDWLKSF